MRVAVVGAGKMGLPLACQFASRGAEVVACDKNVKVVESINAGVSPIDEPGVAPLLAKLVTGGMLKATTDTATAVAGSDVTVVIVPVLLTPDKRADLSTIEQVSHEIGRGLRAGAMVCYETTLPVGETRRLIPILEGSGLKGGVDFDLVFSPERIKSGTILRTLSTTPKIVGGVTPKAASRGARFYMEYLGAPTINVGSLEAAEFVKLAGMLYRDANIALANELARYAEELDLDIHPLIAAANTDNESSLLRPGIGVGGHCTPVYPYFAIRDAERTGTRLRLAEVARLVNDGQPAYLLDRLATHWRPLSGQRVMVLGLAFRPQVKEHTFSPAFQLQRELATRGADMFLHDPLYGPDEIRAMGFKPADLESLVPGAWILNTAHESYAALDFVELARRGLQAVVDGRAFWNPEKVTAAGVIYVGVGRPTGRDSRTAEAPVPPVTAPPSATEPGP